MLRVCGKGTGAKDRLFLTNTYLHVLKYFCLGLFTFSLLFWAFIPEPILIPSS